MSVVTRFAPSPTGFLHIGGARTALFNWLYAKHTGGTFLLRIEDTDQQRSTPEAKKAIIDSLKWLGLDWDGEPVSQCARVSYHLNVIEQLRESGQVYKCYCTPEELSTMRAEAKKTGRPVAYDGRWRNRPESEAPKGVTPVIRLKTPQYGDTVIQDYVQGTVTIPNRQIDDFVLLRADGTPTYMLAVVADDHDMGVTHIIRGDDHLNNAARQNALYQALGWDIPKYAHVPMIHGPDGAKMSKRHGALGVESYRDMGYLPAALRNYLARLGWSHGDEEIFTMAQAITWFNVADIGKAAARFDFDILTNINAHYIKKLSADELIELVRPNLQDNGVTSETLSGRLARSMNAVKERARTIQELAAECAYLNTCRPLHLADPTLKPLDNAGRALLGRILPVLSTTEWTKEQLDHNLKMFIASEKIKTGKAFQPLRAALTGGLPSPGVYDILLGFGRSESIARIQDQAI